MEELLLRFAAVVAFSTLSSYSVPQNPRNYAQNPFQIKTHFLRDFMKVREELFPFSFSTSSLYRNPKRSSTLAKNVLKHQLENLEPSSSNVVVKRRVSRPVLEHEKVQNFLRQRIGEQHIDDQHKISLDRRKPDNVYKNESDESYHLEAVHIPKDFITNISEPLINVNKSNLTSIPVREEPKDDVRILTKEPVTEHPKKDHEEDDESKTSFLGSVISTLTQLPVIGNVLRASVDPLYRPIVNQLQPDNVTIMRGENDMKNWCFGVLGCIKPSFDFFHPVYRPVNLPPYPREKIAVAFVVHSRNETEGYSVPALDIEEMYYSTFEAYRPTKIVIHGYVNNREETWIWEMVRGLLKHGDYNVITVDWSSGSYAFYSQATANTRVVSLEIARLLEWLEENFKIKMADVHIIGHSLGAHTAGYVGEKVRGIGRISGLDPAEPFFQYMPTSVRLDPTDANFVDVIHTDTDSFFALMGPRGFGLQQAVGHVDFYPNGGKEQPGCNELLTRAPGLLMVEGADIKEAINAVQTEFMNCDHVRSAKLFTDSLNSECPYLGFSCSSYENYKKGECFTCGKRGEKCAFMGINADSWTPEDNKANVKMFLDTHYSPNFCKYHYILTIKFNDPEKATGTLRGRLKISFIDQNNNVQKFDLTASSPIKFPRRGSRKFMLEHFEDLTGSRGAIINWIYESDLLDPLNFCVLFCKADLSIASVSVLSVDNALAASRVLKMRSGVIKGRDDEVLHGGEIFLCHEDGKGSVNIPSESTVMISTSSACRSLHHGEQTLVQTQRRSSINTKSVLSFYNG